MPALLVCRRRWQRRSREDGSSRVRFVVATAVALAAVCATLMAATFGLTRVLRKQAFMPRPPHYSDPLELEVVESGPGTVTLRAAVRRPIVGPEEPGEFGLAGARGLGAAGPVLNASEDVVTRAYRPVSGEIRPGDHVRLDPFGWWTDPADAHDFGFEEVTVSGPAGPMPAWYVPGNGDSWAIMVHGKGAPRKETLRAMPPLAEGGRKMLAISYRNDAGCPSGESGYSYGRDEWADLEAAAQWALDRGATDILLVGYSMGGAIAANFMIRSELARHVRAVVLDSPMLDLRETVAFGVRIRPLRGSLRTISGILAPRILALCSPLASRLLGFRWDDFSYIARLARLDVPVLLIHGDADRLVPVSTSDALAEARTERLVYLRVPGAGHVRAWNADPEAYRRAIATFLAAVPVA